ncbi:MAG: hypothetical protein KBT03_07970 [Bacteroidales bacterium]|nr:hypothetical protein [Candidatus Scybalousia scybalohippi]
MFRRGTTPTVIFTIDNIDFEKVTAIYITIKQGNYTINRDNNDIEVSVDEGKLRIKLTQEDTLKLRKGRVMAQVRAIYYDDIAVATDILYDYCVDVLREDVISNG